MTMPLRIYADFNSGGSPGSGPCWNLRYGPDFTPFDEIALDLGARDGMTVVLFYEDPSEEFEVDAELIENSLTDFPMWVALPDWTTRRDIR